MPLDDIEQDSYPDSKGAQKALRTTAPKNTKKDNVDDNVTDDHQNTRTDNDGGHKKNDKIGGTKKTSGIGGSTFGGTSGTSNTSGNGGNQSNDPELALSNFFSDLFGDTRDDEKTAPPGAGGKSTTTTNTTGTGNPSKNTESTTTGGSTGSTTTGGSTGSTTTGGTTGGTNEDKKDDSFLDKPEEDKGTEYDPDPKRGGEFGSGTKTDDKLPDEGPANTTIFQATSVKGTVTTNTKYLKIVTITYKKDGVEKEATFDDSGYVTIDGKKYFAKNVIINGGDSVDLWLSKQVDADYKFADGKKDPAYKNIQIGWGLAQPDTNNTETPAVNNLGDDPTKSNDPEQKFEPKQKSSQSPEGAPQNVEKSAALTEAKLRELSGKIVKPGSSIQISSYVEPISGVPPVPAGYYAYRVASGTKGQGIPANAANPAASSIINKVKFRFNASWGKFTKNVIRGVKIPTDEADMNIIDYPIIMNFPEAGVWNTTVPYVADSQTEQHYMILEENYSYIAVKPWGIGTYASDTKFANWAEEPWWCGISTLFCVQKSGYETMRAGIKWAAANGINVAYTSKLPKPITSETTGILGNLPMYIDPETNSETADPELYEKAYVANGVTRQRERSDFYTALYGLYQKKSITKKTEITETVNKKGKKGQLIPQTKTTIKKQDIPVTIYESFLPNPSSIIFINGIHFSSKGLTDQGKKLMDHFLSQRGWEVSVISRGGHIEVCPYVNPDGTIVRFGGNTSSLTVNNAGGQFVARPGTIWDFATYQKPATFLAFHKLVPRSKSQKIEPTMNGLFRRTEIVDSYYKAIDDKKVLGTLKNMIYSKIVEPE